MAGFEVWGAGLGGGLQGVGQAYQWLEQYQQRELARKRLEQNDEFLRQDREMRRQQAEEALQVRRDAEARQAAADQAAAAEAMQKRLDAEHKARVQGAAKINIQTLIDSTKDPDEKRGLELDREWAEAGLGNPPTRTRTQEAPEVRAARLKSEALMRDNIAWQRFLREKQYSEAHPTAGGETPAQKRANELSAFNDAIKDIDDPEQVQRLTLRFKLHQAGITPPTEPRPLARDTIVGKTGKGTPVFGNDPRSFPIAVQEQLDEIHDRHPTKETAFKELDDRRDTGGFGQHPYVDWSRARNYLAGQYDRGKEGIVEQGRRERQEKLDAAAKAGVPGGVVGAGPTPVPSPTATPMPRPTPSASPRMYDEPPLSFGSTMPGAASTATPPPAVTPPPAGPGADPRAVQARTLMQQIATMKAQGQDASALIEQLKRLRAGG